MKKTTTGLLVSFLFISLLTPFAHGQSADWTKVMALKDREVAVKNSAGKTTFGKVASVDEEGISIQPVAKGTLSAQTVKFLKSDVKKIWIAELKSGKGLSRGATTAIGAGAGAGAGLGLGLALLYGTNGSDSGYAILGAMTAIGAGAGAALGFFAGKGGHKKAELIYEVK